MKKIEMKVTNGRKYMEFFRMVKDDTTEQEIRKIRNLWLNSDKCTNCELVYFQVTTIK